jgi:hypothetical protein
LSSEGEGESYSSPRPPVVRSSITIPTGRRFTVRTSWYTPDINTTVSGAL